LLTKSASLFESLASEDSSEDILFTMASDETTLVAQDDPYKDVLKSMTLGRRLARYLSGYKWYNPQLNNPDAPSLDKAWAYFEHVTLPRHFKPEEGATDVNRKAESGENQATTQLYFCVGDPRV